MKISLDNLKSEVTTRINAGGLSSLSACQLNAASNAINGNALIPRVATIADLPPVAQSEGSMIYVDDINEYRYSNGIEWTDDVTSTYELVESQWWGWGLNNTGQLATGTANGSSSPVQEISSSTNWCEIGVKDGVTSAIKTDGTLWSSGLNSIGTIGDGTTTNRCSPVREITSSTNWCTVGVGSCTVAAIKTDGTLWGWGNGGSGQLGHGFLTNVCSPVQEFCSATNWCQVSSGWYATLAIKTDGSLWGFGYNGPGGPLLGDGTTILNRCSPVREFCSATNWCQVSVGNRSSSAVKTDGTLWAWGRGYSGILGNGTSVNFVASPVREISSSTNWCQVSMSVCHAAAVKTDGTLWSWGSGICFALGVNNFNSACSPVQEICSATNWCIVSAGTCSSSAMKTDGTVWAWGNNLCGQLGDGTITTRCSPVQEFCSATNWSTVCSNGNKTVALKTVFEKGF